MIQAYITDQNFDIIFLLETFLNSLIQNDDHKLKIDGYNHGVKNVQIRSFFWSVFYHIRTEYREILSISPYSVRMRENTH